MLVISGVVVALTASARPAFLHGAIWRSPPLAAARYIPPVVASGAAPKAGVEAAIDEMRKETRQQHRAITVSRDDDAPSAPHTGTGTGTEHTAGELPPYSDC